MIGSDFHKILAENTWLFGEEYNLWVSDKDLRRVLEKHRDHLDPSIVIDEPVKVIGKARGIIDLMFSRSTRRHRANDIENMIVELKAPKVKIGADEITQAKKYAIAVTSDERFSTVDGVRWHFWLVSNAYDDFAKHEIESGPDRETTELCEHRLAHTLVEPFEAHVRFDRAHDHLLVAGHARVCHCLCNCGPFVAPPRSNSLSTERTATPLVRR